MENIKSQNTHKIIRTILLLEISKNNISKHLESGDIAMFDLCRLESHLNCLCFNLHINDITTDVSFTPQYSTTFILTKCQAFHSTHTLPCRFCLITIISS